ncbi:MAG: rhomboid family intramembrane serine protease [Verrucomicrobia bacterium]|nr:rhomboid family intramembrane serine protease [Verrucomicrobiota bacterium]
MPRPVPPKPPPGDEPPLERHATRVLIALNLAFFAWEVWLLRVDPGRRRWFELNHALSLEGLRHGAWWQCLTFQFLHGGWVHLTMNLLLLHSLGPILETTLGRFRFLALYLVSGTVGGMLHVMGAWLMPDAFGRPVVGASAGLCGLLAALGAYHAEERLRVLVLLVLPMEVRAKFILLAGIVVSALGAVLAPGSIAHLAHLGGFMGGLALALGFQHRDSGPGGGGGGGAEAGPPGGVARRLVHP